MEPMSRITAVTPNDDYTLLIALESEDKIIFNMRKLVKTVAFRRLDNLQYFKQVGFEDKAICWGENVSQSCFPERLTLDDILFSLRD